MSRSHANLRAGDWIEVRGPAEIAQTLDAEGTLNGIPFMPEMLQFCGRRFRVARPAEKTCVEFAGGEYKIREFCQNDVLLLEGLRCSGDDHDGCQRGCVIFWRAAWVRKVESGKSATIIEKSDQEKLRCKLKTTIEPGRYFCQSTQLAKTTQPLTRSRMLLKCLYDVRSGSRGILEMARLILSPLWRKVTPMVPRRPLTGTLQRTPDESLNLQPGELVEIKSKAEIVKTLDSRGRTRGLLFATGPWRASRGAYQVRNRVDRMILEGTGEMRQAKATVILEGLTCTCENVLGGCPRQDTVYWREVWLRRAGPKAENGNKADAPCASARPSH